MIPRSRVIDSRKNIFTTKEVVFIIFGYVLGNQFLVPFIAGIAFVLSGNDTAVLANTMSIGLLVLTLLFLFVLKDNLIQQWYAFKENGPGVWKKIIQNNLLVYALNLVLGLIVTYVLRKEINAANQDAIIEQLQSFPIMIIVSAVLVAPILEEIFFRGLFHLQLRSFKNFSFPIILSSLIFGFVHIIAEFTPGVVMNSQFFMVLLVNLFQYSLMGFAMSRATEQTDSIFGGYFVHLINNTIAIGIILLTFI